MEVGKKMRLERFLGYMYTRTKAGGPHYSGSGDLWDSVQLTRGEDKMLSPHPPDSIMHKREID